MEHSESSTQAQVVSIISMSFVGVSIIGMIVNTLEATQYTDMSGNLVENPILSLIETTSVAWFTLEYLLRFLSCLLGETKYFAQVRWVTREDSLSEGRNEHYRRPVYLSLLP